MIPEFMRYKTRWTITKYASEAAYRLGRPYQISTIKGNVLLNEGIQAMLNLLTGISAPTQFSNAAAYIGVGDSSTGESASHTGLQAATNKTYKAMDASYPQRSNQTVTWRSTFASGDANYAWNEFTVANGNSDAATNLNRKVSAQGTKTTGQTWVVDIAITIT
jgi:hypothetical protein